MIPSFTKHILEVLVCTSLLFQAVPLMAETLPVWEPGELTRHSDLVVIGRLRGPDRVEIGQVLKGKCSDKELFVPSLKEFAEKDPLVPSLADVKLTDDVILFLSQRGYPPSVVANGIYRVAQENARNGVIGYSQPMNPGGYVLEPKMLFQSLSAVKEIIDKELTGIPERQKAMFDNVKAAKTNDDFRQALHNLEQITRIGDMDILRQVAELAVDDSIRRVHNLYQFIQNVRDPEAAGLLEGLYDKTGDVMILCALGRLGSPKSLTYFELLIEKKQVSEPLFALYGMEELYLALEQRGDQESCDATRESIYKYVDKDLMCLMMSYPQLISVIPHQGSIDRLQRAYEYHAKRESNAEYEIEMCIRQCKEKIARIQKKGDLAQPGSPADADKPRR